MTLHPVWVTAESLSQIPPTALTSGSFNILVSQSPSNLLPSAFCPRDRVVSGLVQVRDVLTAESHGYSSGWIYWFFHFLKYCGPFLFPFRDHDTRFLLWVPLLSFIKCSFGSPSSLDILSLANHVKSHVLIPTTCWHLPNLYLQSVC